jgi:hypothetical protein
MNLPCLKLVFGLTGADGSVGTDIPVCAHKQAQAGMPVPPVKWVLLIIVNVAGY